DQVSGADSGVLRVGAAGRAGAVQAIEVTRWQRLGQDVATAVSRVQVAQRIALAATVLVIEEEAAVGGGVHAEVDVVAVGIRTAQLHRGIGNAQLAGVLNTVVVAVGVNHPGDARTDHVDRAAGADV